MFRDTDIRKKILYAIIVWTEYHREFINSGKQQGSFLFSPQLSVSLWFYFNKKDSGTLIDIFKADFSKGWQNSDGELAQIDKWDVFTSKGSNRQTMLLLHDI